MNKIPDIYTDIPGSGLLKSQISPYSVSEWEQFKHNIGRKLIEDGIDCDTIVANLEFKEFVANYANNLLSDKNKVKMQILNRTLKFMNVDIEGGVSGKKIYPIIGEYDNHFLIRIHYFAKDETGKININFLDIIPFSTIN